MNPIRMSDDELRNMWDAVARQRVDSLSALTDCAIFAATEGFVMLSFILHAVIGLLVWPFLVSLGVGLLAWWLARHPFML